MTVFIIIGVLFLALAIIVPLIEKSGARVSDETTGKISRYLWPLIGILLVAQLIMMMF